MDRLLFSRDLDGVTAAERLAAVERAGLLDTPPEESFDRATRLAARLLSVPVSLVTIVAADRQFFKSQQGLGEPWASRRETPLSHSFCKHVVADDRPLVVADARQHPLVASNAAVDDLGVVAYLGVPVRDDAGQPLGALCAINDRPRRWDDDDLAVLEDLAGFLGTELRLRQASGELAEIARTERAARERGERSAEVRFRRLAENSSDAIFVLRFAPAPSVVYLNAAVEQITGYPRATLLDDPALLQRLLGVEDRARLRVILDSDSEEALELQCRRRDGSMRWVSLSTTVLTDDDGAVELVQGVARDIDRRKRAELALQEALAHERHAARRTARLNQMIATFLTAISHELRTPLTAVVGFADLLVARREDLSDQQHADMLERLRGSAHRLRHLLEDVLDVDRLARGELSPDIRPVRVDTLIARVVGEVAPGRPAVTVAVPPLEIRCDPRHLERIVANLVGNAVRHTPPGTPIEVSAHPDHGVVVLVVDDHGPGIPDDLQEQVFEAFVHGPEAADAPSPGTGLGLTLTRELAQLNGGAVELGDRPGGGLRVRVSLPAAGRSAP